MPFTVEGVEMRWLANSGFVIEPGAGPSIVIDPYEVAGSGVEPRPVDAAFITHPHYDHLSVEDLEGFVGDDTVLVSVEGSRPDLEAAFPDHELVVVAPGDETEVEGVPVEAVPAYNVNKNYHPRDEDWVGFVLTLDAGADDGPVRLYHAGDTDRIPAMEDLNVDVALLPVGGTYVMDHEEAAKAAGVLDARVFVPMHYGSVAGTPRDAERFAEVVGDRAVLPKH